MIGNTLLLAIREIRRNLLRSFLTILGIVIGVSAVITMVTLGRGATQAVQAQIASLGSNLLQVRPASAWGRAAGARARPRSARPIWTRSPPRSPAWPRSRRRRAAASPWWPDHATGRPA